MVMLGNTTGNGTSMVTLPGRRTDVMVLPRRTWRYFTLTHTAGTDIMEQHTLAGVGRTTNIVVPNTKQRQRYCTHCGSVTKEIKKYIYLQQFKEWQAKNTEGKERI